MKKEIPILLLTAVLASASCRGLNIDPQEGGAVSETVAAPDTIECSRGVVLLGPTCGGMWKTIVGCCADASISSASAEALICGMNADEATCARNPAEVDVQCDALGTIPQCQWTAGAGGESSAGAGASHAAGGVGVVGVGRGGAVDVGWAGSQGISGPRALPQVDPTVGSAECEAACGPCNEGFYAPNSSVCCESRPCYCNGIDTWYSTVDCAEQRMFCAYRNRVKRTLAYCSPHPPD